MPPHLMAGVNKLIQCSAGTPASLRDKPALPTSVVQELRTRGVGGADAEIPLEYYC